MRLFWIALVFVFIGVIGYAYSKDPKGCWKIVDDLGDLFVAISPVKVEIKNGTATFTVNNSPVATNTAPDDATTSAPVVPPPPHVIDPNASVPSQVSGPPGDAATAAPAASPSSTVFNNNATGFIASLVNGKLIANGGGAYTFPANAPLSSIRYYAIYYSASWCPPCHAFTPELVQWYNGFKPSHPDFELIFVSEDHDEDSQLGYMKEMTMPWPAVRFGELKHDGNNTFKCPGIEEFAGNGIPDLVLVDPNGKVLLDSFQNGTYVGPQQVMNGIAAQVGN